MMDGAEFYRRASRAVDRLRNIEVNNYDECKLRHEWERCGNHVQALRALSAVQGELDKLLQEINDAITS